MMKMFLTIMSYAVLSSISASAGVTFLPENELRIPLTTSYRDMPSGLTEGQFNQVIDRINLIYSPIVNKEGGRLIFNRNWEDATVNASASRDMTTGSMWYVSMYGGLARHPLMTEDAFSVVVCHELGHHLGGYPKKRMAFQVDPLWGSNEGQADYFATLKCLRKVFEHDDNQSILKNKNVPREVVDQCQKSFPSSKVEQYLCQRNALAGFEVAVFLNAVSKDKNPVSFTTPDTKKVLKIHNDHPKSQCRLDTLFMGAVCDKSVNEELSKTDGNIGACTYHNGDTMGMRPRCWMKKL